MAWHYITYSCGHNGRVQIYGPNRGRPALAQKEADRDCENCRAEAKAKAYAAATEAAKEDAEAASLPALTGTARQVDWAMVIRAEQLRKIKDMALLLGATDDQVTRMISLHAATASARWWIDQRHRSITALVKQILDLARSSSLTDAVTFPLIATGEA